MTAQFMTRTDLENLLRRLGELAHEEGIRIDLFIVGGAAMALAYNEHRVTSDLDAVFEPKNRVYELAQRVAAESELKIDENWLDDGVKGFLIGEDPAPRGVLTDVPGLSVRVASPRYPFALKAMAARESDLDDLHILYPLCGFSSVEDALSTV